MSKRKLKRLPVVDSEKRLVGIISRLNILNVLAAGYLPQEAPRKAVGAHPVSLQTVAQVMDRAVPTVLPETNLAEVLALLAGTRVKRVIVVDSQRHVSGIISDSDLVVRMSHETHPGIVELLMSRLPLGSLSSEARSHLQKARSKKAADLMTCNVVTLVAESPIGTALALSAEKHIKRFPVVDETGKLVGIVGRGELLSALVGENPQGQQPDDKGER